MDLKHIFLIVILLILFFSLFFIRTHDLSLEETCYIKQGNITYSYFNYTSKEVINKDSNIPVYINNCET